eukprot:SAG31_NODE_12387_length_945_cov_2.132388_1_plen_38_part_10
MVTRADVLPVSRCDRTSRLRFDDFKQTAWQHVNEWALE